MKDSGQIIELLKKEFQKWDTSFKTEKTGKIIEVGDGVAKITGLSTAAYNEMLEFPNKNFGLALNLEEETISAIILGDYLSLKEGDEVRSTGKVLEVPVGEELIGRVLNPLGMPLDEKGPIKTKNAS